jgi:hypothetical protein
MVPEACIYIYIQQLSVNPLDKYEHHSTINVPVERSFQSRYESCLPAKSSRFIPFHLAANRLLALKFSP